MNAVLIAAVAAAGGGLVEAGHYLAHHRTGLTAAVVAVLSWTWSRRRWFVSTGRRVKREGTT